MSLLEIRWTTPDLFLVSEVVDFFLRSEVQVDFFLLTDVMLDFFLFATVARDFFLLEDFFLLLCITQTPSRGCGLKSVKAVWFILFYLADSLIWNWLLS